MIRELGSVCVFCGSSSGTSPVFADAARDLGTLLASSGIRLVYGGGAVGLMGDLADATLAAGGQVTGVIPRGLFRREVAHRGIDDLIEVASMHERKQLMYELSDAFVALPGGLGTIEELAEIATWVQLGLQAKPIVTLNVARYWDRLHDLLRHAADAGFIRSDSLDVITNVDRLDELLDALRHREVPYRDKWIDLPQS
jgi:hypothetical protein